MTGWRDPYVGRWPALADLFGRDRESLFGLISGGLADSGLTLFLYSIRDVHDWTYLGPLVEPRAISERPARPWTGDWGTNWECGGFFQIGQRSYLFIAPQGHYFEPLEPIRPEAAPAPKKWQLWASGHLQASHQGIGAGPKMQFEQEGVLDWGCLYAAQTFEDREGRRLMIGESDRLLIRLIDS